MLGILETWWLMHVDSLLEITVKKWIFHIKLMNKPMSRDSQAENSMYSWWGPATKNAWAAWIGSALISNVFLGWLREWIWGNPKLLTWHVPHMRGRRWKVYPSKGGVLITLNSRRGRQLTTSKRSRLLLVALRRISTTTPTTVIPPVRPAPTSTIWGRW